MSGATDPGAAARHRGGLWPLIREERTAPAADLADLADEQWAAPSLCTGLAVREVPARLTAGPASAPCAGRPAWSAAGSTSTPRRPCGRPSSWAPRLPR